MLAHAIYAIIKKLGQDNKIELYIADLDEPKGGLFTFKFTPNNEKGTVLITLIEGTEEELNAPSNGE